MTERISSRSNARVKALRAALAAPGESVVALEGVHLLEEAARSGIRFETIFVREDQEHRLRSFDLDPSAPLLVLSREAFDSAAATSTSQGIAALLPRPRAAYTPRPGDLTVLAAGVQDPGNLGTLIRSAEAFGASAMFLVQGTVDPWNAKCLRASAGSVFRLPLLPWSEEADVFRNVLHTGARLLAAVVRDGTPAPQADLAGTVMLVIGNEGSGIPRDVLSLADARITLPMPGNTESLNAGVAGSILLYEAARQRAAVGAQ